jgi:hypothetical protein
LSRVGQEVQHRDEQQSDRPVEVQGRQDLRCAEDCLRVAQVGVDDGARAFGVAGVQGASVG